MIRSYDMALAAGMLVLGTVACAGILRGMLDLRRIERMNSAASVDYLNSRRRCHLSVSEWRDATSAPEAPLLPSVWPLAGLLLAAWSCVLARNALADGRPGWALLYVSGAFSVGSLTSYVFYYSTVWRRTLARRLRDIEGV